MASPTRRDLFAEDDSVWEDEEFPSTGRSIIEWVTVVAGAVAVALLIKTFVVQAFFIPSGSMEPTLFKDDRVLVNKLSYRLHDIKQGDVIVFERPEGDFSEAGASDIKDLIKRVVALPGQTIYFDKAGDGKVYVNGQPLSEPYLTAITRTDPRPASFKSPWPSRCIEDDPCRVPNDSVWVLGDNRENSQDSRYIGPIKQSLVVGRAFIIVWPLNRVGGL